MKGITMLCAGLFACMLIFSCNPTKDKEVQNAGGAWKKEGQVLKTIHNIHFNFPDNGYAFDKKKEFIEQCFSAMHHNSPILGISEFTDTIRVRFLKSRSAMNVLTGMAATGIAQPHIKTLFVVADTSEKIKPPIKHELMHLMAMLTWGYPHFTSTWINEGIATYAEDHCNGYSVSEVYRYLLDSGKLIKTESLTRGFYEQPEMIAYHQSAYTVEYLIKEYGIASFKQFWSQGIQSFESIYGITIVQLEKALEQHVLEEHPEVPPIDWETFKEGCMK